MKDKKIKKLTVSALLCAFACVATMLIRIPTPTKGYVNLGDCIVNVSGWLLGPVYGAAAGGIGSGLADLFAGYTVYAPVTLIIKGAMAVVAFYVFKALSAKLGSSLAARIISAIAAEIVMILGYFAFESIFYGSVAVGATGLLGNVAQVIMGAASSVAIYEIIIKRIPRLESSK